MGKRKKNTKDLRINLRLTEEEKDSLKGCLGKAKDTLGASTVSEFIRRAAYWQILRLEAMARLKEEGIPEDNVEEAEVRMRFMEAAGDYMLKYAKEGEWEKMERAKEWMKEVVEDEAKMLADSWKRHFSKLKEGISG